MAKTTSLFICCLLLCRLSMAQPFNFTWTRSATGDGDQNPLATATDPSGNIYLAGYFGDTDIVFGGFSAHTPYSLNAFVVKYSPAGTPLWLRSANVPDNTNSANAQAVATNGNGNVLITGSYNGGNLSFGSNTLPVTNGSNNYMFITEYDSAGNVLCAKAATTDYSSYGYALATDPGGNIYAAGFYTGDTVAFDSIALYNSGSPGGRIIYVVNRYNEAGTVQWAQQSNPGSNAVIQSMATDRLGNIYISGYFINDSISFGNMTVYNPGVNNEIFLFKLNPQGQAVWAKGFAEDDADYGFCVATDHSNNVYLAGGYSSDSLNFGNVTIHNSANGDQSAYIAKFDAAGNNLWAKTAVATQLNATRGLTTDINNNVYIAGEFTTSTISFDSTTLNEPDFSEGPVFLVGLDSNGKVLSSTVLNTADEDHAPLCADTLGNIYLGGYYGYSFGIDTFIAGADTFYANYGKFSYLSKINNNLPVTYPIYHHMLDTVNIWHYTYYMEGETPPPNGGNNARSLSACNDITTRGIVYTGAESVIDGRTYMQVNVTGMPYENQDDSCLLGYIREDTTAGKVYFLDVDSASEFLMYDFLMHVGDSMQIAFTYDGQYGYFQTGTYTLDSILPVTVAAGVRNEFYLNCDTCSNSHTLRWIEGVGCLADVIYPNCRNGVMFYGWMDTALICPGYQHDFSQFVVCYEHSQRVYFDSCAYAASQFLEPFNFPDSCDYYIFLGGGIKQLTSLSSFTAYPNPANDQVTLQLNVAETADFDIDVKDVEGKTLSNHLHLGQLNPGLHNADMDISTLSPGFYIVECRTAEGSLYCKLAVQR